MTASPEQSAAGMQKPRKFQITQSAMTMIPMATFFMVQIRLTVALIDLCSQSLSLAF